MDFDNYFRAELPRLRRRFPYFKDAILYKVIQEKWKLDRFQPNDYLELYRALESRTIVLDDIYHANTQHLYRHLRAKLQSYFQGTGGLLELTNSTKDDMYRFVRSLPSQSISINQLRERDPQGPFSLDDLRIYEDYQNNIVERSTRQAVERSTRRNGTGLEEFHTFVEQQIPILNRRYKYFTDAISFAVAIERWNNGNPRTTDATISDGYADRSMEWQLSRVQTDLSVFFDFSNDNYRRYESFERVSHIFNLFELKPEYRNRTIEILETWLNSNFFGYNVSGLLERVRSGRSENALFLQTDIVNHQRYVVHYEDRSSPPLFNPNYVIRDENRLSPTLDPSITQEMILNFIPGEAQPPYLQGFTTAYLALQFYPTFTFVDAVRRFNLVNKRGQPTVTNHSQQALVPSQTTTRQTDAPARQTDAPARQTYIPVQNPSPPVVMPTRQREYVKDTTKAIKQETIEKRIDGINFSHIANYYYRCTGDGLHPFNMSSIVSYCATPAFPRGRTCYDCPTCYEPMDNNLYAQPPIVDQVFNDLFNDFLIDDQELVPERVTFMGKFLPILGNVPREDLEYIVNDDEDTKAYDNERAVLLTGFLSAFSKLSNQSMRDELKFYQERIAQAEAEAEAVMEVESEVD